MVGPRGSLDALQLGSQRRELGSGLAAEQLIGGLLQPSRPRHCSRRGEGIRCQQILVGQLCEGMFGDGSQVVFFQRHRQVRSQVRRQRLLQERDVPRLQNASQSAGVVPAFGQPRQRLLNQHAAQPTLKVLVASVRELTQTQLAPCVRGGDRFDEVRGIERAREQLRRAQRFNDCASVTFRVRSTQLAFRPELGRAEIDHRFDHVQRSRIERRLCSTRLADHHVHFRETAQQHVASLQVIPRLRHRNSRDGDRHVHDHALIQRHSQVGPQRPHHLLSNQTNQHERPAPTRSTSEDMSVAATHSHARLFRRSRDPTDRHQRREQHCAKQAVVADRSHSQQHRHADDPRHHGRMIEQIIQHRPIDLHHASHEPAFGLGSHPAAQEDRAENRDQRH